MPATTLPKTLTLPYHQDPGHGWIAVPRTLARQLLGPDFARISPYSYQQRSTGLVFLEEDRDAGLLVEACKRRGIELTLSEHHSNHESSIRNLPPFAA